MLGCWVAGTIVPPSDGPIFQQCLQNSFHNYFYYFYCFIFFYNLKRPSHQPTVLFPIYKNNDLTIRRWDVGPINPGTQRIILKIVGFQTRRRGGGANSDNHINLSFPMVISRLVISLVLP